MKKVILFSLVIACSSVQQMHADASVYAGLTLASAAAATLGIETELRNLSLEERAALHSKNPFQTRLNLLKVVAQEIKSHGLIKTARKFKRLCAGTTAAALLLALIPAQMLVKKSTDATNQSNDSDQANPKIQVTEEFRAERQRQFQENQDAQQRKILNRKTIADLRRANDEAREAADLAEYEAQQEKLRVEQERQLEEERLEIARLAAETEARQATERQAVLDALAQITEQKALAQTSTITEPKALAQTSTKKPSRGQSASNQSPRAQAVSEEDNVILVRTIQVDASAKNICSKPKMNTTLLKQAQEAITDVQGAEKAPHLALLAAYNALFNYPGNTAVAKRAAVVAVGRLDTLLMVDTKQETKIADLRIEALKAALDVKPSTRK